MVVAMDEWLDAEWIEERARAFHALSNPRRLEVMMVILAQNGNEVSVSDIQAALPAISQPSLSQHLTRLREAKLTYVRQQGPWRHIRAAKPQALKAMLCDIL